MQEMESQPELPPRSASFCLPSDGRGAGGPASTGTLPHTWCQALNLSEAQGACHPHGDIRRDSMELERGLAVAVGSVLYL